MPFPSVAMEMDKVGNDWQVASVALSRPGQQSYSVAANAPRAQDGRPLPFGKPFRCAAPTPSGGSMVTQLEFIIGFAEPWHNSPHDPFDANRTVILKMDVAGVGQEDLLIDLSCLKMPHAQPSTLNHAVHAAVTLAIAVVHFFKQVFMAAKPSVTE